MQGTKDPIPLINLHETFAVLYTGFVFTRQDDQTGFQMEFYFRFSCPATTFNEAYSNSLPQSCFINWLCLQWYFPSHINTVRRLEWKIDMILPNYSGGSRISPGREPTPRGAGGRGANLLFGQSSPKTAWKSRKLDRGGALNCIRFNDIVTISSSGWSKAGAPGARPPQPKMFSISCSFWENLAKSYVDAPVGESWIRPCAVEDIYFVVDPGTWFTSVAWSIILLTFSFWAKNTDFQGELI